MPEFEERSGHTPKCTCALAMGKARLGAPCRRLFLDKLAAVRARIAERRGREAAATMEAERRAAAASAEV